MQIKQMLFPMMSMELGMAPCSHLHAQVQTPVSQMEKLDRGLVALPAQDKGIFLSWRLLGTDSKNVCFDIERDGKIIAHQVKLTNYTDRKGSAASSYRIITYQKEPRMDAPAEREVSKAVKPWNDLYRSCPSTVLPAVSLPMENPMNIPPTTVAWAMWMETENTKSS